VCENDFLQCVCVVVVVVVVVVVLKKRKCSKRCVWTILEKDKRWKLLKQCDVWKVTKKKNNKIKKEKKTK
jgi:hypothetical protein